MFEPQKGHSFLIVLIVMLAFATASDHSVATGAQGEKVVGQRRYLLLDDRNVSTKSIVNLVLGKPVKHPSNPLFGQDRPWGQVSLAMPILGR